MSILRTLNTGAAGLKSHGEAMGVVGDNIANVNTIGFKRSRANFQDILGRSIAGANNTPPAAGAGSRMGSIDQMWTQGALLTTDSPMDLALSGEGFFVVSGNVSGNEGNYYTRAGQFHMNEAGEVVNLNGMKVQGYGVDANGVINGTMGDLVIPQGTVPAEMTANVTLAANLDSNSPVPALPWDPTNPAGTSNFSTDVTVYDSLGNSHDITTYFRNNGAGAWEWHSMVDGGDITGGTPGVPFEGASGTLTFDLNGALDAETQTVNDWDFLGAVQSQTIDFDFGTSITGDGGTGLDGTTQMGSPSNVTGISQDGFGSGTVAGVQIGSDGTVTGVFTNGQRRTLGQLVVADFRSVDGLSRAGEGLWTETQASGAALVGAAESGSRGSIVAGALEQSNIDLGREFVDMIAYQRGFSANSKVITTSDEMYSELVNLKR